MKHTPAELLADNILKASGTGLQHYTMAKTREEITAAAQAPLTVIDALVGALEDAQNGLRWYQEMHPSDSSAADDEMHETINAALKQARGE